MQEELEEMFLMSEEEVQAIRHYKVEELKKAYDDLFTIGIVPALYEKQPKYIDYKTFEENFRKKLKVAVNNRMVKINSEIEKRVSEEGVTFVIKLEGMQEDELDLFDKMLSLDYSPPSDFQDISAHLLILVGFYIRGNTYIPSVEMRVDLSMCKLIGVVNRLYGATEARGKTTLSGRKKQEANVASSQTEVFEAFQYLGIKNKSRFRTKRRIAQEIIKYLEAKNEEVGSDEKKKIPSERTVIRYLDSNDKIRNDLIEMGVTKDKPTLV